MESRNSTAFIVVYLRSKAGQTFTLLAVLLPLQESKAHTAIIVGNERSGIKSE
jgi:hypothetical protein